MNSTAARLPVDALFESSDTRKTAFSSRLEALVEQHFDSLWRFLRRLGVGVDAVDDAAQEVFTVLARRIADVEPGAEKSFLFGTAVHVAKSVRRCQAIELTRYESLDDQVPANAETPEELLDDRRALEMLDSLLVSLGEPNRTVFVLFELEGFTVSEISDLLTIPRGTVASRLRRSRAEFLRRANGLRENIVEAIMDDEKRLLDRMGSGFERDLLLAAGREPVPESARKRVALAVLIAAPALPQPAPGVEATVGTASKGAGSVVGMTLKWLAIGAVAGGLSGEGGARIADVLITPASHPAAAATTPLVRERTSGAVSPSEPIAAEPEPTVEIKERPRSVATTGTVVIGKADLELESESLRRIRAISTRDPERALAMLDAHDKQFPHGVLVGDVRSLRAQIRAKLSP